MIRKKEREMVLRYMAEFNQDLYDGKGRIAEVDRLGAVLKAEILDCKHFRASHDLSCVVVTSTSLFVELSLDVKVDKSHRAATLLEKTIEGYSGLSHSYEEGLFYDRLVSCLKGMAVEASSSKTRVINTGWDLDF